MSEQAVALADQLTSVANEFAEILRTATDEQVTRTCPGDGWPVLLTAYHVAGAYRVNASWIRRLAAGETIAATRAQIDAGNAQMAQDTTVHTRAEVLTLLQDNFARLVETIRNLSDEQLKTSATFGPSGGQELTVKQVIRHVVIAHVNEHLADVRAALA